MLHTWLANKCSSTYCYSNWTQSLWLSFSLFPFVVVWQQTQMQDGRFTQLSCGCLFHYFLLSLCDSKHKCKMGGCKTEFAKKNCTAPRARVNVKLLWASKERKFSWKTNIGWKIYFQCQFILKDQWILVQFMSQYHHRKMWFLRNPYPVQNCKIAQQHSCWSDVSSLHSLHAWKSSYSKMDSGKSIEWAGGVGQPPMGGLEL